MSVTKQAVINIPSAHDEKRKQEQAPTLEQGSYDAKSARACKRATGAVYGVATLY